MPGVHKPRVLWRLTFLSARHQLGSQFTAHSRRVGPQYGACFTSAFRPLEFGGNSLLFLSFFLSFFLSVLISSLQKICGPLGELSVLRAFSGVKFYTVGDVARTVQLHSHVAPPAVFCRPLSSFSSKIIFYLLPLFVPFVHVPLILRPVFFSTRNFLLLSHCDNLITLSSADVGSSRRTPVRVAGGL